MEVYLWNSHKLAIDTLEKKGIRKKTIQGENNSFLSSASLPLRYFLFTDGIERCGTTGQCGASEKSCEQKRHLA